MMVGLPCSGKSTFIENHITKSLPTILSADDNVMSMLQPNENYIDSYTKYAERASKKFYADVDHFSKMPYDVIVDRTNLTKEKRVEILEKFSNHKKVCFFISMDPKLHQTAIENRPEKVVPPSVMESMRESLVAPSKDEGFDTIYRIHTE